MLTDILFILESESEELFPNLIYLSQYKVAHVYSH